MNPTEAFRAVVARQAARRGLGDMAYVWNVRPRTKRMDFELTSRVVMYASLALIGHDGSALEPVQFWAGIQVSVGLEDDLLSPDNCARLASVFAVVMSHVLVGQTASEAVSWSTGEAWGINSDSAPKVGI